MLASDLATHPYREARRAGLAPVAPGAWIARTQPATPALLVAAVAGTLTREHAFLGPTALWLHGVAGEPDIVQVGVPHRHRLTLPPPVVTARVSAAVLRGRRVRRGAQVVRLEIAVVQACAGRSPRQAVAMLEQVLRGRRTTAAQVKAVLARGLAGSAAARAALRELSGGSLERQVRVLRAALERCGVTGLQAEARLLGSGGMVAYGDLLHQPTGTLLEVDGFLAHVDRDRFRGDRRRDRWVLAEHGIRTLRVDAAEVEDDLDHVADELAALLHGLSSAAA